MSRHRPIKASMAAPASIFLAVFGIVLGWVLFGAVSMAAVALSVKGYLDIENGRRRGNTGTAIAGFGLGLFGVAEGFLTLFAVIYVS